MRLVLANHSSYPRVGEGPRAQRLRRAYARRETGELTDDGYREVARDYIAQIIVEQESAGVELVTDGLVHWYDLISHLASRLEGIRIDGLVRFFDTNTYVRQPEIVGRMSGTFGSAPDFAFATSVAQSSVKPVLPGPYTLARHSIASGNGDLTSMTMAFADLLGAELTELARAGAGLVQIEEPSLLRFPEDVGIARTALERAVGGKGDVRVSLVTYFGDASSLYGELLHMPVDMLGFDLVYGPSVADLLISQPPDRPVALGALDGRNTKLDDTDTVARTVGRVAEALGSRGIGEIHLQPSCGLEFLPRDRAKRKLERMREIGRAVEGVSAQ